MTDCVDKQNSQRCNNYWRQTGSVQSDGKWSYAQIENVDVDVRGFLISNRGKLFATNEVQLTNNAIDIFHVLVDHMSCSAKTYASLGASNGCADQLTNWDGTQKVGFGTPPKKESQGLS